MRRRKRPSSAATSANNSHWFIFSGLFWEIGEISWSESVVKHKILESLVEEWLGWLLFLCKMFCSERMYSKVLFLLLRESTGVTAKPNQVIRRLLKIAFCWRQKKNSKWRPLVPENFWKRALFKPWLQKIDKRKSNEIKRNETLNLSTLEMNQRDNQKS